MKRSSNLKIQSDHLEKKPAKRKSKDFSEHPQEKLSLEDIERVSHTIQPAQSNNENLDASDGAKPQDLGSYKYPGTSSPNSCDEIEFREEALFFCTLSSSSEDSGPLSSSSEDSGPLSSSSEDSGPLSSSSEDSDEELSEVNKKTESSPDYNLLGENKKPVDTPASEVLEETCVPKESFSRDKTINNNSNKNASNDLSLKTQGPLHVDVPSVLCHSTKDADVLDKSLKSSCPPMESFSKISPFSHTNKDTAPKTTPKGPKPKLTKCTLLRKPIVCKSIQKNPMIKENHDDNKKRIVDCSGTKQGITCIKITRIFSDAGINNDRRTEESCTAKENPQHMSMLKPCDTSTFHEDTKDKDNTEKTIKPDFSVKPVDLVKRKIKDVHHENDEVQIGSVKKLHHSEDNNIDGNPISVEQKELSRQRLMQTPSNNDDDDDSVLSFFAPDDLIGDIDDDEKELKRTWNKFEREKLDCKDKDQQGNELTDKEESTHQISSRQFTQKKSNLAVDHSNKKEIMDERGDAHSHDSSRVEKFKLWNQTGGNVTANDNNTKSCPQSIIKDYCLLYLRLSVESHHGCNLIHQVPSHLFSAEGIQDEKQVVDTINYIIKTNFRNPPQDFVSAIVSYCVKCNQSDLQRRIAILVNLGNALKGVKIDKAEQLWCTFFKAISQYLILPNTKKSMHIGRVLEGIFGNQLDFRSEDCAVFKLTQKALIEVHRVFKSHIQLLMCIGFMCEKASKSRLDVRLISPEFALSIVKQCLDEMNILPLSVWKKFAYKVVCLLISDHHFGYVVDLCNHDQHSVSQFIKIVESMQVTESTRFSRIKQFISINEIETPSLEQRPLHWNLHLTTNFTAPGSNIQTISTSLNNSYSKGELVVNEVYSHFKNKDRKQIFISCLSLLKEDVKEHLSDVIMSFLSDEASNENWDICYELFKCLPNWDFKTIKNLKGNRTPTSNLLTVILVLLKNNKTTEAVNLFFQYELFKHEADWILNYIKEDLVKHDIICSIFSEQIKSLGKNRFFTTMRLISEQDTLDAPINLVGNVVSLISELIQKGHNKEIGQLVTRILDDDKDDPLLVVIPSDMYRAIVVVLCQENKFKHALLVFLKAMKIVSVYPCIPITHDSVSTGDEMSVEFDSSLNKEEMKVIVYTILIGFGHIIKNSGFSVKFKEFIDDPQRSHLRYGIFKTYILVEDTSVRNSIQRFRRAVTELIPNARFKTRDHDCIEIEKISLKEFVTNNAKELVQVNKTEKMNY